MGIYFFDPKPIGLNADIKRHINELTKLNMEIEKLRCIVGNKQSGREYNSLYILLKMRDICFASKVALLEKFGRKNTNPGELK